MNRPRGKEPLSVRDSFGGKKRRLRRKNTNIELKKFQGCTSMFCVGRSMFAFSRLSIRRMCHATVRQGFVAFACLSDISQ
jgi:hypothetical protein